MFGQSIDESKFDCMIHGDIHNDQVIGKFVSVGNPIQHDMSSQSQGTAVILDTDTKMWRRIKIDPDHKRFLRMNYVDVKELEGFSEDNLTYRIYKPKSITSKGGVKVELPGWSEVDELVTKITEDLKLRDIHDEVKSKCIEYSEVDFNFQLKSLEIKGFRSVVDFKITFDGNDRVALFGKNGSGKSSIIKALKAVFENSRGITAEQSDLCQGMLIRMTLLHQDKLYTIWKGSSWGVEVDGKPLNYNNKTSFDSDLLQLLPFLRYTDLFFITSDVQNLSSRFTPDRRIELLSRFYRLDRIDAYCKTASVLKTEVENGTKEVRDELNKRLGSLENTERRLSELSEMKDKCRQDFVTQLSEYNDLIEKDKAYTAWKAQYDKLSALSSQAKSTLDLYKNRLGLNLESTNSIIDQLNEKKLKVETAIKTAKDRSDKLISLISLRSELIEKGRKASEELKSLDAGLCPTCGSTVTQEKNDILKKGYQDQLDDARTKFNNTKEEYESYSEEELVPNYFKALVHKLDNSLTELKEEILMMNNKITQYNLAKEDYDAELNKYNDLKDKETSYGMTKPEQVQLPIDIQDKIFTATSELNKYDDYVRESTRRDELNRDISELKSDLQDLVDQAARYQE
jgi:recombinational DNA repair ATPase RecF